MGLAPGYFVRRSMNTPIQSGGDMQTNDAKAAFTEKLSLGTLIVILTVTNLLVFWTLAPYA
jgi:hypothetical protein